MARAARHKPNCIYGDVYGNLSLRKLSREYLSSIFSAYNFFYHSDSLSEVRKIWSDKLENWWRVYVSTTADSAIFIVIPLQYLIFCYYKSSDTSYGRATQ